MISQKLEEMELEDEEEISEMDGMEDDVLEEFDPMKEEEMDVNEILAEMEAEWEIFLNKLAENEITIEKLVHIQFEFLKCPLICSETLVK
jgi:hypothetical protein